MNGLESLEEWAQNKADANALGEGFAFFCWHTRKWPLCEQCTNDRSLDGDARDCVWLWYEDGGKQR